MSKPTTSQLPQSANIVSRWLLTESSGNRSDSVGSNTLTDNNTVAAGAGLDGEWANSADFEAGNSEYLSITDASQTGLDPAGAFTISAWVKLESVGVNHCIMTKVIGAGGPGTSYYRFMVESTDKFFLDVWNGSSSAGSTSAATLSAGVWYHIVCVYSPSTRMTTYLNGVVTNNNTTSIPSALPNNTYDVNIGRYQTGSYFDGLLQDVVFWNVALTDAEVANLYSKYSSSFFNMF